jgi:DNA-binding NarL/FixJ family response regulator
MDKIRVFIADDHHLFTEAVTALLASHPQIEITGTARTGAEALESACDATDVVLMDLTMPVMDGIEATRRLLARDPRLRIVAVSGRSEDAAEARAAGAVAFLHKGALYNEVVDAVLSAARTAPSATS